MQTDSVPGSKEKMCRAGFLQLLIANDLDRTPICKVRAGFVHLFNANDCFGWRVQPLTNNLVRFASVILGMLPSVKLERYTFVDLVTLPFVNPFNTAICQNMHLKITSTI